MVPVLKLPVFGNWSQMARFDLVSGAAEVMPTDLSDEDGYCGFYSRLGDIHIAAFRQGDRIRVALNDRVFDAAELSIAIGRRTPLWISVVAPSHSFLTRRTITVRTDNDEIAWAYTLPRVLHLFDFFSPTEERDFDFGVFLKELCEDEVARGRLLERWRSVPSSASRFEH